MTFRQMCETTIDHLRGEVALRGALSTDDLLDDLLACLNTVELARRKFREVARVAGLVVHLALHPFSEQAVREVLDLATCSGVPWVTIFPPPSPASGPMSMM